MYLLKAVLLNSAKLDFDKQLDFSPLSAITKLTNYSDSLPSEIVEHIADNAVVITKELVVNQETLLKLPTTVKLICEAGTGYNNIDVVTARERGIKVCNIGDYSAIAVAQLAITFMLNFSCSMMQQQKMLCNKDYSNFTTALLLPHFELSGKTLGVLGAGTIAMHVVKIARVLGMNVLVNSQSPRKFDDPLIQSVTFDELLAKSDFISIHCPLTPATKYLFNTQNFSKMKPTAYLINTARGAIIHEQDLITALATGQIAGAALDVQENEPLPDNSPLFNLEKIILTPHIGWKRIESRQRLIKLLADNIIAFQNGKNLNIVN